MCNCKGDELTEQVIVDKASELQSETHHDGGPFKKLHRDPTPEELETPEFNALWELMKAWDICTTGNYDSYSNTTGNHIVAVLDALKHTKHRTKTAREIEECIRDLEKKHRHLLDQRPATVAVNAPVALMQMDIAARLDILYWVIGQRRPFFKMDEQVAG